MQVARLINREAQEKTSRWFDLAGDGPEVLLGDSTKIEQVCLKNILINAMQAMPVGGVIRVASRISWVGQMGASLLTSPLPTRALRPPENVPRLFDPYFTTRSDGTGLGLRLLTGL